MEEAIEIQYGNRLRVRICGLCWQGQSLLLVNHRGITDGSFWAPPGGGLEFGSSASDTLEREFQEETGLVVRTGRFMFACEYINPPLHAVELFFEVSLTGGKLITGTDPELQIIDAVRFLTHDDLAAMPRNELHGIFKKVGNLEQLRNLSGFYRI